MMTMSFKKEEMLDRNECTTRVREGVREKSLVDVLFRELVMRS